MLRNNKKKAVYEGIMDRLGRVVRNAILEQENGWRDKEMRVYSDAFMGNKEFVLVAERMDEGNIDHAQVWLCQKVAEKEYDAYSFIFEPKAKTFALIKGGSEDTVGERAKNELAGVLPPKDSKVRDIYIEKKDVGSALRNISPDTKEIASELSGIIWRDASEQEGKTSADKNAKAEDARFITSVLKKISEDDEAFAATVSVFRKIEAVAAKHDGDYAYVMKAVDARLSRK